MPGFEIFGDEEKKEVHDVLYSGVLFRYGFDQRKNDNLKTKKFEQMVSKCTGTKYCHLCSSGTSALSIALAACGIGAGDEIIVPPFTFVATIEAVLYAGAIPIFSEIDQTLCIDPQSIESLISKKTKAVLLVHMCGSMAHIDKIKMLCDHKGLILIEDACQSFGSTFKKKALGSFGNMGCFSFDPVKTITCGEGGAIITNDKELYLKADAFSDHGHDHIGNDRGLEGHSIIGMNFRISELNAAVGLAQLKKLNWIIKTQRMHKKAIKDAMSKFNEVTFRKIPDEKGDSATFLSFFLSDEDRTRKVAKQLKKNDVDACFYWYDNNWHYFKNWNHIKNLSSAAKLPMKLLDSYPDYTKLELPQSDKIMSRTISIQIKLSWTEEELKNRIKKIENIFK